MNKELRNRFKLRSDKIQVIVMHLHPRTVAWWVTRMNEMTVRIIFVTTGCLFSSAHFILCFGGIPSPRTRCREFLVSQEECLTPNSWRSFSDGGRGEMSWRRLFYDSDHGVKLMFILSFVYRNKKILTWPLTMTMKMTIYIYYQA